MNPEGSANTDLVTLPSAHGATETVERLKTLLAQKGIEEFHQEIAGKNYKYLRPGIETTFYEARCVEVIDPFGDRIRFKEDLQPEKAK